METINYFPVSEEAGKKPRNAVPGQCYFSSILWRARISCTSRASVFSMAPRSSSSTSALIQQSMPEPLNEDTPEKKARLEKEAARFRADWADVLSQPDPYYNPNFSLDMAPFSLY